MRGCSSIEEDAQGYFHIDDTALDRIIWLDQLELGHPETVEQQWLQNGFQVRSVVLLEGLQ